MNRLLAIESPSSPVASRVASMNSAPPWPTARTMPARRSRLGNGRSGFRVKSPVIDLVAVDDRARRPGSSLRQRLGAGGDDEVAAEQQARAAGGDAHGVDPVRAFGDADMAHHRAALLRHAELVEHGDALPLQMRRHAEQRPDRHDAGAADPGDENAVGLGKGGQGRLGQRRQVVPIVEIGRAALAQAAAMHRDKARAETLEAGKILVAARLVDRALAAEFGLDRHDRQAVRGRRAVAAALANQIVDKDPLRRVRKPAALAAAAFFGGAGLVVDDRGDAADLAQFALHPVEFVAVPHARAVREFACRAGIYRGSSLTMTTCFTPSAASCAATTRHGQAAVERLAAGHRDGIVEQHLVGHRDPGGDRGADRHDAGMGIGAVADIGEDVRRSRQTAPARSTTRPRRPSG